jgi:hypothetical protein
LIGRGTAGGRFAVEMMKRSCLFALLAAWTAFLADGSLAHGCSVCVTGAGNDPSAEAFNWSVLFLMAAPYVVAGSIAGWLVYSYRRLGSKRDRAEEREAPLHLVWKQKENGR